MKKIALILCLVLVASFVLSGCNNSDSIITLEDREVGKIEIQSGNTGETVEVTEEEVQHLPEQFRPLVEKARELLPVPEVQQPEREQERGHTWGGMEL